MHMNRNDLTGSRRARGNPPATSLGALMKISVITSTAGFVANKSTEAVLTHHEKIRVLLPRVSPVERGIRRFGKFWQRRSWRDSALHASLHAYFTPRKTTSFLLTTEGVRVASCPLNFSVVLAEHYNWVDDFTTGVPLQSASLFKQKYYWICRQEVIFLE